MEPCISVAIVVDQLAYIRRKYGDDVIEAAIASLGETDRDRMRSMTSLSWLPVRVIGIVKSHMAESVGHAPLAFQREVVVGAARATLNGVFRALLRLVSDSALEKRAGMIYRRTYNTGSLTAEFGPSEARFVIHDWVDMPMFERTGLEVGFEVTLEVTGRKGAVASSRREADHIVFQVHWTKA